MTSRTRGLRGFGAFGAIQAALVHRERTGEGQAVDVSLMDSMLNLMVFECQEAQFPSQQKRPGLRADEIEGRPRHHRTDQPENFEQMADAMQRPVLKTDTPFATNSGRVRHWNELMAVIEQWTGHRTGVEIESIMDGAAFPAPAFSPSRTP